jgi:hypothetical protein
MNKQNTFNPMDELENKTTEELQAYNEVLEQSSEYKRILPEVMNEVYSLYVKERIESLERLAEAEEDEDLFGDYGKFPNDDLPWEQTPIERKMNKPSFLIATAKSYLPDNPERAADVLSQIGSCHRLWDMQKTILKEKYDITWYTPAELHPEIKFD